MLVFPSVVDQKGDMKGFGLVMVEAMGCECSVIASDLPPIHDIIIDNEIGIIVEQKNVRQIAYGTIYLLDNPDNLKSFGKAGRKYVLERYDWDITENKYYDLFEKLEQRE